MPISALSPAEVGPINTAKALFSFLGLGLSLVFYIRE